MSMAHAIVGVVAALFIVLWFQRGRLVELGTAGVLRLALIWAVIIMVLFLIVRLFGF